MGAGNRVYHVGALTRGFYACEFRGITDEYLRDHPLRDHWQLARPATPELMTDPADQVGLGFAAFRHFYSPPHPYESHSAVLIPYWAPVCLFAVLPVAGLVRRARRYPADHCHRCGYDLRASPERCPECGTPAATPSR